MIKELKFLEDQVSAFNVMQELRPHLNEESYLQLLQEMSSSE